MKKKTAIILVSPSGLPVASVLQKELEQSTVYTTAPVEGCTQIDHIASFVEQNFTEFSTFIFIGAMGICVRSIAPCLGHKHTDPAVINVDSTGKYVVSVLSGHVGGANELTRHVASVLGAEPVITTQSDNSGLWALDLLPSLYHWVAEPFGASMNQLIAAFVNGEPTALLLEVRDAGTSYLERTLPPHVHVCYRYEDIPVADVGLIIAVTPRIYTADVPVLYFRPKVLHLGMGCRKEAHPQGVCEYIKGELVKNGFSPLSVVSLSTIDLKKEEPLLADLQQSFGVNELHIYSGEELNEVAVPHPSEKVDTVTGTSSVAEASAILASGGGALCLEKQKGVLTENSHFTFAVAMDSGACRGGHIEIVGAGPGDPDLISVKGRHFLEEADLILYAGSLVPRELTYCAKKGATVRSSASLALEEQFALMKEFYDRGQLVVRLHTGDPCIYGAIQEQMAFFDQYGMRYHITPGISSFQAAAAALQSQFTIPEKVQTIILTRGEGRTPMPDKEKLHLLARSQSTMCIFLSAGVVDQVQAELLQHYPPTTPVAACYHLTWKDERIYRGELQNLASIVKENNLTLTTMIVVGDAIDNREGLSKLYSHKFTHLFRKGTEGDAK
jgi:precorrin-4 C11-methyltransferase